MDKYLGVNLLKIVEGRPYFFNVPQMRQTYEEVLEVLEMFKSEVLEMQKLDKERSKEQKPVEKESSTTDK